MNRKKILFYFATLVLIIALCVSCSKEDKLMTEPEASLSSQKAQTFEISNYESWDVGESYVKGDTVSYESNFYKCIKSHTANAPNWNPPNTPALWNNIGIIGGARKPFPSNGGGQAQIIPGVSKADMNEDVENFYEDWKDEYVENKGDGKRIIKAPTSDGENKKGTQSEAMGYGMVIAVLMEDKDLFDGLWKMCKPWRSVIPGSELIAWDLMNTDSSTSATDGDMDIAYGLCLAAHQWSNQSPFDESYISYAKELINEICEHNIYMAGPSYSDFVLNVGDWNDNTNQDFKYASRPSDWMPSHFNLFHKYVPRFELIKARDWIPSHALYLQEEFSPEYGFLPDFVRKDKPDEPVMTNYVPAAPNYLERPEDGDFFRNACRFPLRFAVAHKHDPNNDYTEVLENFMEGAGKVCSSGDISKFISGYELDGDPIVDYNNEKCFGGPILAAAVAVNDGKFNTESNWDWLANWNTGSRGYFNDTIAMLSMLIISDNWWQEVPE